jgi:serine/threonine-protein kinase
VHSFSKDYLEAISDYDEAIRSDPQYASAYRNRGDAFDALGQEARAAEDYKKAVQLEPAVEGAINIAASPCGQ